MSLKVWFRYKNLIAFSSKMMIPRNAWQRECLKYAYGNQGGYMRDDERLHDVIRMLYEYSARPPLKFPSEAEIPKIGCKILDAAYGPKSLWTKWDKDREEIIGRAVDVWVPMDDLLDALNTLPGEKLTATDVDQRLYALRNEHGGYSRGPDEAIKEASFTAYDEEKAKGTEFIAILGSLEEWTWGPRNA
jgi:hypothetical protein